MPFRAWRPGQEPLRNEADMGRWTEDVRTVLERTPTGALPLSSIGEELKRDGVFLNPRDPWLLTSIREDEGTFGIIPLQAGPWIEGAGGWRGIGSREDPWILLKNPPSPGFGRRARTREKVGDGVRAWASGLDQASPSSVARWIRANLEGARICTALAVGD